MQTIKMFVLIVCLQMLLGAIAGGAELPQPLTPDEISNVPLGQLSDVTSITQASWLWSWLGTQEAQMFVVSIISLIAGIAARLHWIKKWRLERAIQCLAGGVRETYEEYVRGLQKAREDGKLTTEERKEAMRLALEKAKLYAANEGFDLAKVYAKEYLPVLAERIIGSMKASGRAVPFPSLPDLEPR